MALLKRILWWEPLWVLLLGAPVLLPGRFVALEWQPYVVVGLLLFWPLGWITSRRIVPSTPVSAGVLGLLLWLPITLWASADRETSWIAAGYLLWGMALFVALVRWPPAQRTPALLAGFLVLMGSGVALISPAMVEWKPQFRLFHLPLYEQIQSFPIRAGETIHANVLAGVLVLVLPLLVALATHRVRAERHQIFRWLPWGCAILALFLLGVIVITQSRGGYLAVAAALGVIMLLRWPRLLYVAPVGLLLVALLVWRMGYETILDELSNDGALGGWTGRLDIWRNSLTAISDFVFTGIGLGTFTLVIPLLYPLQVNIEGYPHAHNLYLQIGVDMGVPGLLFYLSIVVMLFVMLVRLLRDRSDPLRWTLALGGLGGLVALLVHGLLDAVTWGTKIAFVPWLLFALITLLYQQQAAGDDGRGAARQGEHSTR